MLGNVLVTGGSGFLARGIYRRARREGWAARFTCYSRGEHAQEIVKQQYPEVRCVIGDVRDADRLRDVMTGHDLVIHAGAMKRVPEGEHEPIEVIKTNVLGSLNVIEAAKAARVVRAVSISTDKACEAVNTYGMSKAIAERAFAGASNGNTTFTTVRYGNVVGSTGSVIPLFQRQMCEGGRLSVTDPKMTRFWMSIDDAVDCILFALDPQRIPGSVTVPRPKAMSIGDLARTIAGEDGRIDIVGPRPGEKDHERLIHYQESLRVIEHQGYYELVPVSHPLGAHVREAMTVSSQYPSAGWVTPAEMLAMIEDAAHV